VRDLIEPARQVFNDHIAGAHDCVTPPRTPRFRAVALNGGFAEDVRFADSDVPIKISSFTFYSEWIAGIVKTLAAMGPNAAGSYQDELPLFLVREMPDSGARATPPPPEVIAPEQAPTIKRGSMDATVTRGWHAGSPTS
jgi:hypothetical protein